MEAKRVVGNDRKGVGPPNAYKILDNTGTYTRIRYIHAYKTCTWAHVSLRYHIYPLIEKPRCYEL